MTYLLVGTAACAFFSDPMVDAVTNFSRVGFLNLIVGLLQAPSLPLCFAAPPHPAHHAAGLLCLP